MSTRLRDQYSLSKDFYNETAIENWSCVKMVEYYRSNLEQKDLKKVLDQIRKDLEEIANSDSEFDTTRKDKAQSILDDWKVIFY
jgi:hypothetical protein